MANQGANTLSVLQKDVIQNASTASVSGELAPVSVLNNVHANMSNGRNIRVIGSVAVQ